METTIGTARRVPELESHLGYWLRRVSNAVSGAFARTLQQQETSVAEWVLLREVYKRGQAAPGDLADDLGLTRGAVSKVVDKLEAKEWVRTYAKEGDGRYRLLSLTRTGERTLPILAEIANQNDEAHFGCLSAKERVTLRQLLVKLAEHNQIEAVPTE